MFKCFIIAVEIINKFKKYLNGFSMQLCLWDGMVFFLTPLILFILLRKVSLEFE